MLRIYSIPSFSPGKSIKPMGGLRAYVDSGGVMIAKDQATLGAFKALQRANNAYWAKFQVGGQLSVDGQIGRNTLNSVAQIVGNMVRISQLAPVRIPLAYSVPESTRELASGVDGYTRMISDYGGIPFPSTVPDRLPTDYRAPAPTSPEEIDAALAPETKTKRGPAVVLAAAGLLAGGLWLVTRKKKRSSGMSGRRR